MADALCSTAAAMRIGGEVLPAETVKQRFRQLDSEHVQYIAEAMRQTTTKINNIRTYLLTALYNTPVTIGPYYSCTGRGQAVRSHRGRAERIWVHPIQGQGRCSD